MPVAVTPAANTTVTVEPCSAFPAVVPVQATVPAPATTAAQAKPCRPCVVENTATGTTPATTPAGTRTVRFHCMLPVTAPVPVTVPVTWQFWPTRIAHGCPCCPLGCTSAMACGTVSPAPGPFTIPVTSWVARLPASASAP